MGRQDKHEKTLAILCSAGVLATEVGFTPNVLEGYKKLEKQEDENGNTTIVERQLYIGDLIKDAELVIEYKENVKKQDMNEYRRVLNIVKQWATTGKKQEI
jgi:hypothetical protein